MKIAIDVETTGFHKRKNEVIQIGACFIDENLKIGETFSGYLKPERPQYYGGEKAHGITLEQAMRFPDRKETLINFLHFLAPYKDHFPLDFVSHDSGQFDFGFLKNAFIEEDLHRSFFKAFCYEKITSTIDLARQRIVSSSYALDNLCEMLGIELDHHEALSDAIGCAQIYCKTANSNIQTELSL